MIPLVSKIWFVSVSNVYLFCLHYNLHCPEVVTKQFIVETGYGKCKGCSLDNNNLFGIGWNGKTYFAFDHWTESIKSYKYHIQRRYKGGDYYEFLDRIGYATDPNYTNKLKKIDI